MGSVRCQVRVVDNQHIVDEIHKVVVHKFHISDVDDPDIYAAEPIWKWQQSDAGKFVMEHAIDKPVYHKHIDHTFMGYKFVIVAELEKKKLSEFYLKWGSVE